VKPAAIPVPESAVLSGCVAYLDLMRAIPIRINSGGVKVEDSRRRQGYRFVRFNHGRGISDILACLRCGHFCAVECKSSRGKATVDQLAFIDQVKANGGVGCVIRSVDELVRELAQHSGHCPLEAKRKTA